MVSNTIHLTITEYAQEQIYLVLMCFLTGALGWVWGRSK
jgi:hypothetical protein